MPRYEWLERAVLWCKFISIIEVKKDKTLATLLDAAVFRQDTAALNAAVDRCSELGEELLGKRLKQTIMDEWEDMELSRRDDPDSGVNIGQLPAFD